MVTWEQRDLGYGRKRGKWGIGQFVRLTAPWLEGQAEMAMGDAVPADEGEERVCPADAPATETAAASATADAEDSANDPSTQAGTAPLDGVGVSGPRGWTERNELDRNNKGGR